MEEPPPVSLRNQTAPRKTARHGRDSQPERHCDQVAVVAAETLDFVVTYSPRADWVSKREKDFEPLAAVVEGRIAAVARMMTPVVGKRVMSACHWMLGS